MTHRELILQVRATLDRAGAARQVAKELQARAEILKADAKRVLEHLDELDRAVVARKMRGKVPDGKSTRDLALHELNKSLRQLETLRMTPTNDPELIKLKRDIRKTIRRAGKQ